MLKNLRKLLITILYIGIFSKAFGQAPSITFGNIDPGPYGPGSSIAIPITINDPEGLINAEGNRFQLFILKESGSYLSGAAIGEITGHYTTFVNGIIPKNAPAGLYKFRLRITKINPKATGDATSLEFTTSDSYQVVAGTDVQADLNALLGQTFAKAPKTFGKCAGIINDKYNFTNNSKSDNGTNPVTDVHATITNGFNPSDARPLALDTDFPADTIHYTIFVRAKSSTGIIGTKAFFLINNRTTIPAQDRNVLDVCVPFTFNYKLDPEVMQKNFPGNRYIVKWGDGAKDFLSYNRIKSLNGTIQHEYLLPSCGLSSGRIDAFAINCLPDNTWCFEYGLGTTIYAYAVEKAKNLIGGPDKGCLNIPVTFDNISLASTHNDGTQKCENTMLYNWTIDGVEKYVNKPKSFSPIETFATTGWHTIKLHMSTQYICEQPPDVEHKIFIENAPVLKFNSPEAVCLDETLKPVNQSVFTEGEPIYNWSVDGPDTVNFINGTTEKSSNPEIKFSKAGIYNLNLGAESSCNVQAPPVTIAVNEKPIITAEWPSAFCSINELTFNGLEGNPAKITFSKTYGNSDSYLWKVTGGESQFKDSNANSKNPTIIFKEFKTYTISVTYENSCGSITYTKDISFRNGISISAGPDQNSCKGASFTLGGTVTNGTYNKIVWSGGKGKFSTGVDELHPVYHPHVSETDSVKLTLTVFTNEAAPCNEVSDDVVLSITSPVAKFTWTKDFDCKRFDITDVKAVEAPDNLKYSWSISRNGGPFVNGGANTSSLPPTRVNDNEELVVKLSVTSKSGCETAEFTHTFRTIVPEPLFIVKEKICTDEGLLVTFENTTPSKSALGFKWDFGNGLESTLTDPPAITFPKNTDGTDKLYNIRLEIISPPCSILPAPITIPLTVGNGSPQVDFKAVGKVSSCGVLAVKFENNTTGATNYLWDFGDGETCSCDNPPTHTYSLPGKYTVTLTAFNSTCSSTKKLFDIVRIDAAPKANFEIITDPLKPNNFKFKDLSISEGDIIDWRYDFGDADFSNNPNAEHTYKKSGTYTVKLLILTESGCKDEITKTVDVIAPAEEELGAIYVPNAFLPNSPVTDLRIFKAKGGGIAEWRMRIFNKWGETVWETTELDSQGSPIHGWDGTMNGTPVPQGVYFWEIKAKMKDGSTWPGISYKNSAPKHVGTINLIR